MKEEVFDLIRFIYLSLMVLLIITSSILITYNVINLKSYSYYLEIGGLIGLIIYIASKINHFKFNKYEIIIFILMVLSSLSLLTAINIKICLFGKINRYEGLFVILTYYILLLNTMYLTNKKYIKTILYLIFSFFILNLLYGLFQVKILPQISFIRIINKWKYARGFFGNSMFFSSFACINYAFILGMYIIKKKIGYFILLILSTIGIVISGAMSAYVTVIIISIIVFIWSIYLIIKKDKSAKKNIVLLLISLLIFGTTFYIFMSKTKALKKDVKEVIGEYNSIKEGKIEESFGTGRIHIWKNTLEKIIENKGVGVGIDNFYLAFKPKLIDTKSGLVVDKAHNEYLQKMICEGLISGIAYTVFLFYIFLDKKNYQSSPLYFSLFLSFTAYCIQAFFNISVTRVAPFFFIVFGLLMRNKNSYIIK